MSQSVSECPTMPQSVPKYYKTTPYAALPRVKDVKDIQFINQQLLLPHGLPPITDIELFLAAYREGKEKLRYRVVF